MNPFLTSAPPDDITDLDPRRGRPSILRYNGLKTWLERRFGGPVAKISLDAGLTCPNRDGAISTRGCLFCDPKGSGTGAAGRGLTLTEQMQRGLERLDRRASQYFCYFQSFTNTYAEPSRLKAMWDEALSCPGVIGLAVGTRPDCLPEDVLEILAGYQPRHEVWLELGLQSASDQTLAAINRGHTAADFAAAAIRAKARGLQVIAHVIIGLPGEGDAEILDTARFIGRLGLDGVKIHSLYVSRDTGLAELLARGEYHCLTQDEFVRLAVLFLENLPPPMVIHRLTGDPEPASLLAPSWCGRKAETLRLIRQRLDDLDTWQGRGLGAARPHDQR
ncbi:MAG: TIGR01212 family radical SAM protein [Thermodesulfobacteriota bacterium]